MEYINPKEISLLQRRIDFMKNMFAVLEEFRTNQKLCDNESFEIVDDNTTNELDRIMDEYRDVCSLNILFNHIIEIYSVDELVDVMAYCPASLGE